MNRKMVLHAPNIHVGGGLDVLKSVLACLEGSEYEVNLDKRLAGDEIESLCSSVNYVRPTLLSRLMAEFKLVRQAGVSSILVCLGNLPPLFSSKARVIVFVQNRLLVTTDSLSMYPIKIRVRLWIERCWLKFFKRNACKYIVQTPTMANLLKSTIGGNATIEVCPFHGRELPYVQGGGGGYDFVYIASGDAHKNHKKLFEAWKLLADSGLYPSLAVTLDDARYPELCAEIECLVQRYRVNIDNVGWLSDAELDALYKSSRMAIFASILESFGLPLIEAKKYGLDIVACELDYVRDICIPKESFDPHSATSIARAVRRSLSLDDGPVEIVSAEKFISIATRE